VIGQALAHYRITDAIGSGGMGEVYRATDTKLGREVALKVLPAEMASHPERLERFQREAKALAALDHPGIVTVYSVEEADGVHFLTMQLVEGQPLDRVVPEGGLPGVQILEIATGLADALAAAHEKGVVHRDLKPANGDGPLHVPRAGVGPEGRPANGRLLPGHPSLRDGHGTAPLSEAWLLGVLGEADAAWELLGRAEEERQPLLVYTGLPGFDSLRNDPRFDALLARMRLPASKAADTPT
jgi:hypothetical protein